MLDIKEMAKIDPVLGNVDVLPYVAQCGKDKLILSHYPIEIEDTEYNVHGHIHNTPLDEKFNKDNHLCVSIELTDYKPIDLKELLEKVK